MSEAESLLFECIGRSGFGRWQREIFAALFYANAVGVWQNFAMTFLTPDVPFRCVSSASPVTSSSPVLNGTHGDEWPGECAVQGPDNGTLLPCLRWEYNDTDTLVSQWDLVCDRAWLVSFAKSVYMIGFMASVFFFGQLSDRIGRYPTMVICYVIVCLSLVSNLFVGSVELFLVFRFLQAFGRTGLTTTGYVLLMECVGPTVRTSVGVAVQFGWSLGFLVLAGIGHFFHHWFWFQVAIAVPLLPFAAAFFILPESPRWLMLRKGVKSERKLEKILATAARKNGVEIDKERIRYVIAKLKACESGGGGREERGTLADLFRTPRMRYRMLNMMYQWLVNVFVYYALSFNTNDMSGDPELNFVLAAALEFPSYALLWIALLWRKGCGRRLLLVAHMIALGGTCLAVAALPSEPVWASVLCSQSGKFLVTASLGLLYLYTGELFPTAVRSAALGSCSTVGRIGSIIAPFSRELGQSSHSSVPGILYCVLAVSSGLLAFGLPETRDRMLPDTLEEGEQFGLKTEKECQFSEQRVEFSNFADSEHPKTTEAESSRNGTK